MKRERRRYAIKVHTIIFLFYGGFFDLRHFLIFTKCDRFYFLLFKIKRFVCIFTILWQLHWIWAALNSLFTNFRYIKKWSMSFLYDILKYHIEPDKNRVLISLKMTITLNKWWKNAQIFLPFIKMFRNERSSVGCVEASKQWNRNTKRMAKSAEDSICLKNMNAFVRLDLFKILKKRSKVNSTTEMKASHTILLLMSILVSFFPSPHKRTTVVVNADRPADGTPKQCVLVWPFLDVICRNR